MAADRTSWNKAQAVFKFAWPLLGALIVIVTGYVTVAATVNSNTRRIETLENQQEILVDIRISISEAQTDIRWLKDWARDHPAVALAPP